MKKYTIEGLDNARDIKEYVTKAMREMKLGNEEIREYTQQISLYNKDNLLKISKEYIDMLNEMQKPIECKISYMEV